jgi:acetyltransferase-like isoleucine patch superfamily enzyme
MPISRIKTGLGLYRKYRLLFAYFNLLRFSLRQTLIGFDVANQFIQRVDKMSVHLILRRNGAKIGENCDIETGLVFHNCNNYSNLIIGNNCHIGKNCFFDLRDKIIICDNVVISMKVTFITHIDISKSPLSFKFRTTSSLITVKDGAYIGANSTILMGVSLGKESFVAAGALVKVSVNDELMVGGVPARIIKSLPNSKPMQHQIRHK